MYYKIERMKSIQKKTPLKPLTPIARMQPILKSSWSSALLLEVLAKGKSKTRY
jgi:hypothetical protein